MEDPNVKHRQPSRPETFSPQRSGCGAGSAPDTATRTGGFTRAGNRRMSLAAACLATTVAYAAPACSGAPSRFDCTVTSVERLQGLGRDGQDAELSHFSCRVAGGLLNGFAASGTNVWDAAGERLLASLLVAHKGTSSVVWEFQSGERIFGREPDARGRWHVSARGTYKRATGSAAPLTGRLSTAVWRSGDVGAFTIDAAPAN